MISISIGGPSVLVTSLIFQVIDRIPNISLCKAKIFSWNICFVAQIWPTFRFHFWFNWRLDFRLIRLHWWFHFWFVRFYWWLHFWLNWWLNFRLIRFYFRFNFRLCWFVYRFWLIRSSSRCRGLVLILLSLFLDIFLYFLSMLRSLSFGSILTGVSWSLIVLTILNIVSFWRLTGNHRWVLLIYIIKNIH